MMERSRGGERWSEGKKGSGSEIKNSGKDRGWS